MFSLISVTISIIIHLNYLSVILSTSVEFVGVELCNFWNIHVAFYSSSYFLVFCIEIYTSEAK
jgi:hypothetical protein